MDRSSLRPKARSSSFHKRKHAGQSSSQFLASKQPRRSAPAVTVEAALLDADSQAPIGRISLPHLQLSAAGLSALQNDAQSTTLLSPAPHKHLPPLSARSSEGSATSSRRASFTGSVPTGLNLGAGIPSGSAASAAPGSRRFGTPSPALSFASTHSGSRRGSLDPSSAAPSAFHISPSDVIPTPPRAGMPHATPRTSSRRFSFGGEVGDVLHDMTKQFSSLASPGVPPTPATGKAFSFDFAEPPPAPTPGSRSSSASGGTFSFDNVPQRGPGTSSSGLQRPQFRTPQQLRHRQFFGDSAAAQVAPPPEGSGAASGATGPALGAVPVPTPPSGGTGLLAASSSNSSTGSNASARRRARRRRPMGLKLSIDASEVVSPPSYDAAKPNLAKCSGTVASVTEFLYVGGMDVAKDKAQMQALNITHVLNCVGGTAPSAFPDVFSYCTLNLSDRNSMDIVAFAYPIIEFIERARKAGGKVLVHCMKGISRSTSAVIVYLIWQQHWGFETAFRKVKQARREANPNASFALQISEWERIRRTQLGAGRPLLFRVGQHLSATGPIHLAIGPLADVGLSMFLDDRPDRHSGGPFSHPTPPPGERPASGHRARPQHKPDVALKVRHTDAYVLLGPGVHFVWHANEAPHVVHAAASLAQVIMGLEKFACPSVQVVNQNAEPPAFWCAVLELHSSAVSVSPGLQAYCSERGLQASKSSLMASPMSRTTERQGSDRTEGRWGSSSLLSEMNGSGSMRHLSTSGTGSMVHDDALGVSMELDDSKAQSPSLDEDMAMDTE